jgi:hypothetical protein
MRGEMIGLGRIASLRNRLGGHAVRVEDGT